MSVKNVIPFDVCGRIAEPTLNPVSLGFLSHRILHHTAAKVYSGGQWCTPVIAPTLGFTGVTLSKRTLEGI